MTPRFELLKSHFDLLIEILEAYQPEELERTAVPALVAKLKTFDPGEHAYSIFPLGSHFAALAKKAVDAEIDKIRNIAPRPMRTTYAYELHGRLSLPLRSDEEVEQRVKAMAWRPTEEG